MKFILTCAIYKQEQKQKDKEELGTQEHVKPYGRSKRRGRERKKSIFISFLEACLTTDKI